MIKKLNNLIKYKLRYFFPIVASIPSRLFFGTVTRFWRANLKQFLLFVYETRGFFGKNSIITKTGYLKAPRSISVEFWDDLRQSYAGSINEDRESYLTANGKSRRLIDPIKTLGANKILKIINDKSILNLVRTYYKGDFHLIHVNAWRNFPSKKDDYVYSNFWHMDDFSYTSLRIFCYLSADIDENSGATRIVSIPDSKKIVRSFKFLHTSLDGISDKNGKFPYKYLEGTIGDVLIFSPDRCLHAATSISSGRQRDMLELCVDFRPLNGISLYSSKNPEFIINQTTRL